MISTTVEQQRGFGVIETALVLLVTGVIVAVVSPGVAHSIREHKLNMAVRGLTDAIQRAKTQALSDNRTSSLIVDTAGKRLGLVVYNEAGAIVRTDFVPLPDGVRFEVPTGNTAPVEGSPTTSAVSFPPQGNSTKVFQQDFNSRGFPVVPTPATVNAVYVTNGRSFRAITLTSVGGIRTWWWEDRNWVAAHK